MSKFKLASRAKQCIAILMPLALTSYSACGKALCLLTITSHVIGHVALSFLLGVTSARGESHETRTSIQAIRFIQRTSQPELVSTPSGACRSRALAVRIAARSNTPSAVPTHHRKGRARMSKITAEHLARAAYVYVRQSTPDQVRNNHESRRRQYALQEHAKQLGWTNVVVIDEDLGGAADKAAI